MKVLAGVSALLALVHYSVAANVCASATFQNVTLYGGQVLSITVTNLTNYNSTTASTTNSYPVNVTGLNACQVVVTYTHPGLGDIINVTQLLPVSNWNGRFMALGGGGYITGRGPLDLYIPAFQGFSAASTDGGHSTTNGSSAGWALTSPGNVNWTLLQDFSSVALNDLALVGKAVTRAFYGAPANYSYWNGCSTGGRQGYMMAQRYPRQFNGILGSAPAINWAKFLVMEYWPIQVMVENKVAPRQCELNALRNAAIASCDAQDGLRDGIVMYPALCQFNPQTLVNTTINCTETGTLVNITAGAALVASALWNGPTTTDGKFEWFGLSRDAPSAGLANTTCAANGTCTPLPFAYPPEWIRYFVLKNASYDLSVQTHAQYDSIFRNSHNQYASIISAADADLTDFKNAGGKLLTWHGLQDQLIPPNGTYDYYDRVRTGDSRVADYYRYFPAPGVQHCRGGDGWYPGSMMDSLISWVERGIAPDTVNASITNSAGITRNVRLCSYPRRLVYNGGDPNVAASFGCS